MPIISPDQLSDFVMQALEDYTDEVQDVLNQSAKKTAQAGAKRLRTGSETPRRTGKTGGEYAKSFGYVKDTQTSGSRFSDVYIIRNRKHYRLTHLLEYGHIIVKTGGRTRAFPHIKPTEEWANKDFTERVVKGINAIK